jgi:PAS domain S-box-containing protein
VDEHANVVYISPAVARVLGYTPVQLVGTNGIELIHPSDRARAQETLVLALQSGQRAVTAELRAVHRDGGSRLLEVHARNLLDISAIGGIVVNAQDVTERRQVDEALRSSEERYRSIIETAGEGVIIRDRSDQITFVNQRMADVLGYTTHELIGRPILDIVSEEDRPSFEDAMLRRRGTGRDQFDLRARRKDGSAVSGIASGRPMYDSHGDYVGGLIMFMDITGRKQLEEQLRQAQKMEAVGRLAGGIAHDFNNLLTAVRGNAELMLAEMPLDHALRPDLEEISRAAERASSLTRQLLAFSRRQILQPRVLNIDGVVSEMERLLRRLIGEDVELITRPNANGARVEADRGQLEQVLMNLAVNARDAMPSGGRVTIETDVVDLDDEFAALHPGAVPGSYARLSVHDTGSGMDARTLSHVFEPFFTTKGVGQGTGLGLATVYGIVKQSGGYISVNSEAGTGTRFEIYLPLVTDKTDQNREVQPRLPTRGEGQTVLLVEDEDAVRALASRILRKQGYEVLEASDGMEARRIAENYSGFIHILLTDVVMPRMGGRELVELLQPLRPGIRVLYMSGYTDDALVHHGVVSGGGTWFLEKPFTPEALVRKLREVIEAS